MEITASTGCSWLNHKIKSWNKNNVRYRRYMWLYKCLHVTQEHLYGKNMSHNVLYMLCLFLNIINIPLALKLYSFKGIVFQSPDFIIAWVNSASCFMKVVEKDGPYRYLYCIKWERGYTYMYVYIFKTKKRKATIGTVFPPPTHTLFTWKYVTFFFTINFLFANAAKSLSLTFSAPSAPPTDNSCKKTVSLTVAVYVCVIIIKRIKKEEEDKNE